MAPKEMTDQIYTQWCEDFRALQTVFWQVPFFAMTITGGLGAAVIAFEGAPEVKRLLLFFAGICNFVLIFIAWRVRRMMEVLLIKIFKYENQSKSKSGFFVLKCFTGLFAAVACILIGASISFPVSWLTGESEKQDTQPNVCSTTNIYDSIVNLK